MWSIPNKSVQKPVYKKYATKIWDTEKRLYDKLLYKKLLYEKLLYKKSVGWVGGRLVAGPVLSSPRPRRGRGLGGLLGRRPGGGPWPGGLPGRRLGRRPAQRPVAASDLRCLLVAWRGGHGPTRKSPDQDPRTEAQVVSSRPPRSRTVRRHQQKRSPSVADAKGGRGPERPSHGHTTQPRPIRKSSDQDPPTEAQVVCLRPLWSRMAGHPQQKCNRSGGVIGSWRHSYSHKVLQPWLHLETYL